MYHTTLNYAAFHAENGVIYDQGYEITLYHGDGVTVSGVYYCCHLVVILLLRLLFLFFSAYILIVFFSPLFLDGAGPRFLF